MMTPEEKLELAELLEYRTRSKFDLRRDRLLAAEMRLGMGKWAVQGKRAREILNRARTGKRL
jgi:hypothetical protein